MFTKKVTLTYRSNVHAPVQNLYAFHTDTDNLLKISPPWIAVSVVSIEKPLQPESLIELDIRRMGLTTRWKMRIKALQPPSLVCDEALKSPFKRFVHEHRFHFVDPDNTILEDVITLELPLGPLGWIVWPLIKRDMQKMFDYRHRRTKELLHP